MAIAGLEAFTEEEEEEEELMATAGLEAFTEEEEEEELELMAIAGLERSTEEEEEELMVTAGSTEVVWADQLVGTVNIDEVEPKVANGHNGFFVAFARVM